MPEEKRPKLSKEAARRVSAKIAVLVSEGMPEDQAVATAHSMEREGRLGEHGHYRRKGS